MVVFAAGNNNSSIIYPANSNDDLLVVGAMSPCGERKRSSANSSQLNPGVSPDPNGVSCDNEGWWGSNFGFELDIVAPGVLIPTTDLMGSNGFNTASGSAGDYKVNFNGTSSAAPHVAAVAALILSENPSLTRQEVVDIIESSAQKVGSVTYGANTSRSNGNWNIDMG